MTARLPRRGTLAWREAVTRREAVAGWTVHAGDVRVTVACPDPAAATALAALLDHLPRRGAASGRARLDVAAGDGGWRLRATGRPHRQLPTPAALADAVQLELNRLAVTAMVRRGTGLHAAAAVRDGAAVVLPAASGAGKSTLVAGLLRDGWRYVTDEACTVDPDGTVRGFPKAITVDPGAQPLFPGAAAPRPDGPWYLPPSWFTAAWQAPPAPVATVVLPRYRPGSRVSALPVGPARALLELARCTLYFSADGERNLRELGDLVRRVPVWRLTYPDLAGATRGLDRLLACGGAAPVAR